jgi:hypothetical protein
MKTKQPISEAMFRGSQELDHKYQVVKTILSMLLSAVVKKLEDNGISSQKIYRQKSMGPRWEIHNELHSIFKSRILFCIKFEDKELSFYVETGEFNPMNQFIRRPKIKEILFVYDNLDSLILYVFDCFPEIRTDHQVFLIEGY